MSLWQAICVNWDWANGQSMYHLGLQIADHECASRACDFYYGMITQNADPAQRKEIDRLLEGTAPGTASTDELSALDEFESFLNEFQGNQETEED